MVWFRAQIRIFFSILNFFFLFSSRYFEEEKTVFQKICKLSNLDKSLLELVKKYYANLARFFYVYIFQIDMISNNPMLSVAPCYIFVLCTTLERPSLKHNAFNTAAMAGLNSGNIELRPCGVSSWLFQKRL